MVLSSNLGRDKTYFSSPKYSGQLWGSPSLLYIEGYWGSFPGLKWPEHEVYH